MKATTQQQETIKKIVLKTLDYYIKKQNKNKPQKKKYLNTQMKY